MASLTSRQFLSFYKIRVRKRHSDFLDFDELDTSKGYEDFLETLHKFFKTLEESAFQDKEKDSVIGVEHLTLEPNKRRLSGMVKSGVFGVQGKLHNTKKLTEKKINREDAPLYNFYFSFYLPKDGPIGIFVLHSRGNHGCKTQFEYALKNFLINDDYPISVDIAPIHIEFQKDFKKFHKHFAVKQLEVTEFKPLRNEDKLSSGKSRVPTVVVKRSVKVGRSVESLFDFETFAEKGKQLSVSEKKFKQYVGADLSEKAQFSITVEMDGQRKTMQINQEMHFHMSFDITEDFDGYNRKDPSFTKIREVSESYFAHAVNNITG